MIVYNHSGIYGNDMMWITSDYNWLINFYDGEKMRSKDLWFRDKNGILLCNMVDGLPNTLTMTVSCSLRIVSCKTVIFLQWYKTALHSDRKKLCFFLLLTIFSQFSLHDHFILNSWRWKAIPFYRFWWAQMLNGLVTLTQKPNWLR